MQSFRRDLLLVDAGTFERPLSPSLTFSTA